MSNEHDGTHEAIEHFFRDGIGLAIRVAAEHQQLREKRLMLAREDSRQSFTDQLNRQSLDRALNATRWNLIQQPDWWEKMPASEILRTYESALSLADTDPHAASTVHAMNHEFNERYSIQPDQLKGLDVPADEIEAHWAEHIARRLETERETTPDGVQFTESPSEQLHGPSTTFEAAQAVPTDEKAVEILSGLHRLALSQSLAQISHAHTVHQAVELAANGVGETQARKHLQSQGQGAERDLGR